MIKLRRRNRGGKTAHAVWNWRSKEPTERTRFVKSDAHAVSPFANHIGYLAWLLWHSQLKTGRYMANRLCESCLGPVIRIVIFVSNRSRDWDDFGYPTLCISHRCVNSCQNIIIFCLSLFFPSIRRLIDATVL